MSFIGWYCIALGVFLLVSYLIDRRKSPQEALDSYSPGVIGISTVFATLFFLLFAGVGLYDPIKVLSSTMAWVTHMFIGRAIYTRAVARSEEKAIKQDPPPAD